MSDLGITVRELTGLARDDDGSAIVELLLSDEPDHLWARRFDHHAAHPPTGLVDGVHLERRLLAVRLRILAPVDHERQQAALEWLHDVVAATNASLADD
ncbi:MAG: hypothetical protein U0Q07_00905 [Acidimicrobiales bacterium]